jgi:hypothetical protein
LLRVGRGGCHISFSTCRGTTPPDFLLCAQAGGSFSSAVPSGLEDGPRLSTLERASDGPPSKPQIPEPTPPATDFHSACCQSQMSSPPPGVRGLNQRIQSSASSLPPSPEAGRLDVPSSLGLILAGHAASVEPPTAPASAGRVCIANQFRFPLRVYTRRARRSAEGCPKSQPGPAPSPSSATQTTPPGAVFIRRLSKSVGGAMLRLPHIPKRRVKTLPPRTTPRCSKRLAGVGVEQQHHVAPIRSQSKRTLMKNLGLSQKGRPFRQRL